MDEEADPTIALVLPGSGNDVRSSASVGPQRVAEETENLRQIEVHRFLKVAMQTGAEDCSTGIVLGPNNNDPALVGARTEPHSAGGHAL